METWAKLLIVNSAVYFILDTYKANSPTKLNKFENLLHHFIPIAGSVFALFYFDRDSFIFGSQTLGVFELTNPAWTFLRLRIDNSEEIHLPNWYTKQIAGLVFLISFVAVRFLYFPYFYYIYVPDSTSKTFTYTVYAALMALNVYWVQLLIKGCLKEWNRIQDSARIRNRSPKIE